MLLCIDVEGREDGGFGPGDMRHLHPDEVNHRLAQDNAHGTQKPKTSFTVKVEYGNNVYDY